MPTFLETLRSTVDNPGLAESPAHAIIAAMFSPSQPLPLTHAGRILKFLVDCARFGPVPAAFLLDRGLRARAAGRTRAHEIPPKSATTEDTLEREKHDERCSQLRASFLREMEAQIEKDLVERMEMEAGIEKELVERMETDAKIENKVVLMIYSGLSSQIGRRARSSCRRNRQAIPRERRMTGLVLTAVDVAISELKQDGPEHMKEERRNFEDSRYNPDVMDISDYSDTSDISDMLDITDVSDNMDIMDVLDISDFLDVLECYKNLISLEERTGLVQ